MTMAAKKGNKKPGWKTANLSERNHERAMALCPEECKFQYWFNMRVEQMLDEIEQKQQRAGD